MTPPAAALPPYPRDLIGYGRDVPHAGWPGDARVALQIVLNYEEGGEACILHGDPAAEAYLQEVPGLPPLVGQRNMQVESMYEYGSRAGFWRLMRLFERHGIPITVYAVAMALDRHPDAAAAMVEAGHEIASHGLRWIDYQTVPEEVEREHIRRAVEIHTRVTGSRPLGWYTGRVGPNTRRLVAEYGGFLYDADSYADDLPYWEMVAGTPQLIVPYTLDNNDMKFATLHGLGTGEDFYTYLRDAFDVLYEEGAERPKMMSVGLHCRLAGRPGRLAGLRRFLDHVQSHDRVWITRRLDIARHWRERFPAPAVVEA
ncbi:allantoinase PuuE [Caenispirillum bisanense]|uniref:allantoinase PuuE n=1 Tax=Caenispirillum bisanense TaxID=414052 RepID=UPI0031D2971A